LYALLIAVVAILIALLLAAYVNRSRLRASAIRPLAGE
jgi:hypothetical protein